MMARFEIDRFSSVHVGSFRQNNFKEVNSYSVDRTTETKEMIHVS